MEPESPQPKIVLHLPRNAARLAATHSSLPCGHVDPLGRRAEPIACVGIQALAALRFRSRDDVGQQPWNEKMLASWEPGAISTSTTVPAGTRTPATGVTKAMEAYGGDPIVSANLGSGHSPAARTRWMPLSAASPTTLGTLTIRGFGLLAPQPETTAPTTSTSKTNRRTTIVIGSFS